MSIEQNIINWNSPEVLMAIMNRIKEPLDTITAMSKNGYIYNKEEKTQIIISNTQEINKLIEEVISKVNSNVLNIKYIDKPLIFDIYRTNNIVKKTCANSLCPEKISKNDQGWLIQLESEVMNSIGHQKLSLFELSDKMAVSERQLYRKTKELVHLTPNKYIRILKLHKAKELIDNYVYKSISQLSYAVGYNDSHYFSKLFFKQYNVFPQELLS